MKFKVSDKVRVEKALGAGKDLAMPFVGRTGKVTGILRNAPQPYDVLFSTNRTFAFDGAELELVTVKPKVKPKKK